MTIRRLKAPFQAIATGRRFTPQTLPNAITSLNFNGPPPWNNEVFTLLVLRMVIEECYCTAAANASTF